MFKFYREGCKVYIEIDSCINAAGCMYHQLVLTSNSEPEAQLFVEHMNWTFEEKTKKVRREAYNLGYKNGRGKKEKLKYFRHGLGRGV